jgi:hypothetical protein
MGIVNSEFVETVKRAIRDAIAVDPLVTTVALVDHLNTKFEHSFDPRYIKRLRAKVAGHIHTELDRTSIEQRISSLKETHRIAREALMRIILWRPDPQSQIVQRGPSAQAVAEAAKNLVMLDIAVLNAEVANGLYKNLDEAAAKLDYPALPEEQRSTIASTFKKWNILPPGSIVESVTIHATRAITPAE